MSSATIVVPCFDEASRLDEAAFRAFRVAQPDVGFVLVDDGSRDGTLALLEALAAADPGGYAIVDLQQNRGKAEAVRAGMQAAFETGVQHVGYWDADLSTGLDEIPRFRAVLDERPEVEVVLGARVALMGRSIRRSALRHYLGRVFATVVSNLLGLPIYDTQCGAKLFRNTDETRSLFAEPFIANWTFDVELLARLIERQGGDRERAARLIYELPLDRWHDVAGSKVRPADFVRGLSETVRIYRHYLR